MAELAGARMEQPEPAAVEPRRMRHGEAARHDLAAGNIDDQAAVAAVLAPALGDVRGGDAGRDSRAAVAPSRSRSGGSGPRRRAGR